MNKRPLSHSQSGFSLLEALITMVILAFGLLGLAGLQAKVQVSETESFQRAQALLLVQDMANRISVNRANAASYVTVSPLGTGDSPAANCSTLGTVVLRDQCEWSTALQGAAEKKNGVNIGGMTGARGCVEALVATPPMYRVTVAWQGMSELKAPTVSCGSGSYGTDTYRRTVVYIVPVASLSAP